MSTIMTSDAAEIRFATAAAASSSSSSSTAAAGDEDATAIAATATATAAAVRRQRQQQQQQRQEEEEEDRKQHEHYRIALYYCYLPIPDVAHHIAFHKEICEPSGGSNGSPCTDGASSDEEVVAAVEGGGPPVAEPLYGRVRVASEGINGVLSGTAGRLQLYEERLRRELDRVAASSASSYELDMKYCRLRADLPASKQLFTSLSVASTKYVVSLVEEREEKKKPKKKKKTGGKEKARKESSTRPGEAADDVDEDNENDSNSTNIHEEDAKKDDDNHDGDEADDSSYYYRVVKDVWSESVRSIEERDRNRDDNDEPVGGRHLSPREWNRRIRELTSQQPDAKGGEAEEERNANGEESANKKKKGVVFVDCRNFYESNVGYFACPSDRATTVLTNTRKFTELPRVLVEHVDTFADAGAVFMYCTGGVRCERASVFLKHLLRQHQQQKRANASTTTSSNDAVDTARDTNDASPVSDYHPAAGETKPPQIPEIYQLHGGIQRYLEHPEHALYYRGKNFVFDPRRYDENCTSKTSDRCCGVDGATTAAATNGGVGGTADANVVGRCLVCRRPHDDYDNGHAPCENREARCANCRILVLVCDDCRARVACWGEDQEGAERDPNNRRGSGDRPATTRPRMFCGGMEPDGTCLHRPPVRQIHL